MKTLAAPQIGCGVRGELAVEPAQPRDQLGGGGDHAGLVARSHDLVDRRSLAADDDLPGRRARPATGSTSRSGSGSSTASPRDALADELVELAAVAPGGLVQVVRGQEDRAGGKSPGVAECPDRLDGGGDAPFHVRGAAAGEQPAVLDSRRHERQVDRVEVAVELERPARPAALEPDHHGRSAGYPPVGRSTSKPSAVRISARRSLTAPASPVGLGTSISRRAVSTSRWRLTWGFKRSMVAGSIFMEVDYSREVTTALAGG